MNKGRPQSSRHEPPPPTLAFAPGVGDRLWTVTRVFFRQYQGNLMLLAFRLLVLGIGVFLLLNSGCATIQPKVSPCANLDWFEVGRQDGVSGEPVAALESHKLVCEGSEDPPNVDLYMNGYNAGLVEFCTPQNGLETGRSGRVYHSVCPEHLETKFLQAYTVGRRVYLLEIENADIASRIDQIFTDLSKRSTSLSDQNSLKTRLEELRLRRAQNETQIDTIESDFFERL